MPMIMPIRDLRNTSTISELAHKKQEPIFITKNGYSDLVVMSAELYERLPESTASIRRFLKRKRKWRRAENPSHWTPP